MLVTMMRAKPHRATVIQADAGSARNYAPSVVLSNDNNHVKRAA